MIPSLKDNEIKENISSKDWLIFPLPTEEGKLQAVNRSDPHIDITLRDPGKIRIGIRCNTVKSVERLRNILEIYHLNEKTQLVQQLRALDDRFFTQIISKHKEYNFAQAPKHETLFDEKSNTLNEAKIEQIFNLVKEIRQRGIDKKREQSLGFLPEAPVIDLVAVSVPLEEEAFRSALAIIGPIFETCLRVKTQSEIVREKKRPAKKRSKVFVGYICTRCSTKLQVQEVTNLRSNFCPKCGTLVEPLFQENS